MPVARILAGEHTLFERLVRFMGNRCDKMTAAVLRALQLQEDA